MLSCASEPGLNNPAVRLGTHTSVGPPEVHCPRVASVLVALFLVISHLHNYGSRLPGVLCLNGPRSLLSILGPQPCGWPGQREENWGHWLGVEAPSEGILLPRVLWPKCMQTPMGRPPFQTRRLSVAVGEALSSQWACCLLGAPIRKRPFGWSSENG